MASRKNVQSLQIVGVSIAALGVLALAVWLLWPLLRDLRDVSGAAGQVAGDIGSAVTAVTGGVAAAVGAGGNVITDIASPPTTSAGQGQFVDERPSLRLEIFNKKDWGSGGILGRKFTKVDARITDQNGNPVMGARLHYRLVHYSTSWTSNNIDSDGPSDSNGLIRGAQYWVRDLPGTAGEDDADVYAKKPGYNSSPSIRLL